MPNAYTNNKLYGSFFKHYISTRINIPQNSFYHLYEI